MKESRIEWIGEIPEGWDITSLRSITNKVDTGSTPAGADEIFFTDSGIPWYTPGDFGENEILDEANKYLSALGEEEVKIFPENSVLLVGIGATMGKVALSKCVCSSNQQINIINCSKHLEPLFLVFFIKSITDYLFKCGKFATLPIINQSETKNILIPLPPIMDQRKIINFINDKTVQIDALITEKQKLHDKITAYKKSLIYEYVTGKRKVPDGWAK